jgi:hypothetical protein
MEVKTESTGSRVNAITAATATMSGLARFALACTVAASAALCTLAGAREGGAALDPAQAGIPVYPGAKADAAASAFVRDSLNMTGSAYRTGDDVAKVTAFYDKQNGFRKMPGASREQALFSAGCKAEFNPYLKKDMQKCGYQVTVQNPWTDMQSGKLVRDTLITIVKQ